MMNNSADNLEHQSKLGDPQYKLKTMRYEIVARYPHRTDAFTEGLEFYEGYLYESTGRRDPSDESSLRRVALKTGEVLDYIPVSYFGEGLTILDGKIFQLTYQDHVCLVYDLKSLKKLYEFKYEGEGWGLTNDGHHLIMSDRTNNLRRIDPSNFEVVGKPISVNMNGKPLDKLNELEYVKGSIYANVFPDSFVVTINPHNGFILKQIDLSALRLREPETGRVLNGIAYDEESGHLFVTGKNWDTLFEIRIIDEST